MPAEYQIDAKPYTVWHLTPKGWIIIKPFITDTYTFKTVQTVQIKAASKFDSVKKEIKK